MEIVMKTAQRSIIVLVLLSTSIALSMQKGIKSLANLAMSTYVNEFLAEPKVPSEEWLNTKISKDLQPLIAQMAMKPIVEYVSNKKFKAPQVTSFKLPFLKEDQDIIIDKAGHFAVLIDVYGKAYLIDIIQSMNPGPGNNPTMRTIASFDNQKVVGLNQNGTVFASLSVNNELTVYSTTSLKVLSIIRNIDFDGEHIDFNESGSRLFLSSDSGISVFDIPSGKQKLQYSEMYEDWDFNGDGHYVWILKNDTKTIVVFDIENNKQSQRIFDDDTIVDISCFNKEKCALLLTKSSGEQRIEIVSMADLKTVQLLLTIAVPKKLSAINVSPKNVLIIAEESPVVALGLEKLIHTFDIIRLSDGKIFSPIMVSPDVNPCLNMDETKIVIKSYGPPDLELVNVADGKHVEKYRYATDFIFSVQYVDENNFLMYGIDAKADYIISKCTLLSSEIREQLKKLSLPQVWILRKIYEGIQSNKKFFVDMTMENIFTEIPTTIVSVFEGTYNRAIAPKVTAQGTVIRQEFKKISEIESASPPSQIKIAAKGPDLAKRGGAKFSTLIKKPTAVVQTISTRLGSFWSSIKSWWQGK